MNQAVTFDPLIADAPVGSADRLSFTLFLAALLHAVVILGMGFNLPQVSNSSQTIEITLATHQAQSAVEDADFLAQHNQEASGTFDEAKQLTTTELADFADVQVREVNPIAQQQAAQEAREFAQSLVTTTSDSRYSVFKPEPKDDQAVEEVQEGLFEDQPLLDSEIASLQAKLDLQRQEYAKRPRKLTLTSVSTRASYDAKYLHDWTARIEKIGSDHYPPDALARRITGKLRLSVLLRPDGTIEQITVLQSSGQRVLDDAAKQIVRLASPFATFPAEIRQQADRLEIIRTWNFNISGQQSVISTSAN